MLNTRLTILASSLVTTLALAATGCGSDKPAKAPESTAGITESSSTKESSKEDMPAPPTKEAEVAKPATEDKSAGAAGGMIAIAPLKIKAKGAKGKDQSFELKADGTVSQDGKAIAKITGDQVNDVGGPTLITLGVDGSLVGPGVKVGKAKFEGDDLVLENGDKLSTADDGTINLTKDGKASPIGKVEGGASAKRAALIILSMAPIAGAEPAKASAVPAAAKSGGGTKTSTDKKPAGKK